jgi:hypothetical protein
MFELWHRNFLEKFKKPAGLFSPSVISESPSVSSILPPHVSPASAGE